MKLFYFEKYFVEVLGKYSWLLFILAGNLEGLIYFNVDLYIKYRYGKRKIDFRALTADQVDINLFVCDGDENRGNRETLLNPDYEEYISL